ncbi:MAG: putative ABC exporter domain-containing protein [Gemmatimonadota bacterium]
MTGALSEYLVLRATRNKFARQLRRLRNPRYALALLVGLAYFYWIFATNGGAGEGPMAATEAGPGLELLATLAVAGMAAWAWFSGSRAGALAFEPAEVNFLFTAPLARPELLRYKILKVQFQILFSAALVALIFGRGGELPWYLRLVSIWVLFATLNLHQMGGSLVHLAAAGQGRGGLRRMALPLVLFGAAALAVVVTLARALPEVQAAGEMGAMLRVFVGHFQEPAARLALLPISAVVHPTFAANATAWLAAMPWALLVLALHYAWVLRMDAAFEEAAAEAGRKKASAVAAMRAGKLGVAQRQLATRKERVRPSRLPLAATGPAWRAITWKNAVSFLRLFRPTTAGVIILGVAVVAAVGVISSGGRANPFAIVSGLALMATAMLALFGPLIVRVDLRQDLERLEVLRTYPISGRALVAGQVAAPVLVLSVIQLSALMLGVVALPLAGADAGEVRLATLGLGAALLALPLINTVTITIQNALALLFPAWSKLGRDAPQGIEAMGQGILTMLGSLLLVALALVGPLALAGVVAMPVYAALGVVGAAVAGGVAFLAGLVVEIVWAVAGLGDYYEGMDPGQAGLLH